MPYNKDNQTQLNDDLDMDDLETSLQKLFEKLEKDKQITQQQFDKLFYSDKLLEVCIKISGQGCDHLMPLITKGHIKYVMLKPASLPKIILIQSTNKKLIEKVHKPEIISLIMNNKPSEMMLHELAKSNVPFTTEQLLDLIFQNEHENEYIGTRALITKYAMNNDNIIKIIMIKKLKLKSYIVSRIMMSKNRELIDIFFNSKLFNAFSGFSSIGGLSVAIEESDAKSENENVFQ